MAIWKDQSSLRSDTATLTPEPLARKEPELRTEPSSSYGTPRKPEPREGKESLIASDITIEGIARRAGERHRRPEGEGGAGRRGA